MNIGYARVSTDGQTKSTEAQMLPLAAGCEIVYQENESGGKRERKELNKALDEIVIGMGYCEVSGSRIEERQRFVIDLEYPRLGLIQVSDSDQVSATLALD